MAIQETRNNSGQDNAGVTDVPVYKLYSTRAVVIASFFGTPLAGGYLMAKNYQQLGNKTYARRALFYSLLAVIVSFCLGIVLPDAVPPMAVTLPVVMAMGQAMKQLQGTALEEHQKKQGQFESCWKAWGISLLIMIAVLLIILVCGGLYDPDVLSSV